MSLGSYTIVKNEACWIAAHLEMWLPHLDGMVFLDGSSTDGTLEIIEAIKNDSEHGHKINLVKDMDPKDMREDYVRVFNIALRTLKTDLALFIHPDMVPVKVPEDFGHLCGAIAASVNVRSFAGEPDGQLYEMKGRVNLWKSIARLRYPDLGAHYYGHYGVWNEDVYFSKITGNSYEHHGGDMSKYPYEVEQSGIELLHFSDVRTYVRRLERMRTCMSNQGHNVSLAESHPRVTLQPGDFKTDSFTLVPAEYPAEFIEARNKYRHLERELVKA